MTNAACAIGLDIGGTKIAGGLVDVVQRVPILRDTIPTHPGRGGAAVLEDCLSFAERLAEQARLLGFQVLSLGVGVPELVTRDGRITSAYNFDWRELPALARYQAIAPALFEADVRAAALAEARLGAGRIWDNFAYLSLGTGISYSLVLNGVPYTGARGGALVLASGIQTHVCPACGTVHRVVLEEFASGAALAQRYSALTRVNVRDARAVFAAASGGDAVAAEVLMSAGDALGAALGLLVNLVDPGAIIVGGGLGLAGGIYRERWEASMRAHIWSPEAADIPVESAHLGNDAGWIGAALAAHDTQFLQP